MNPTLHHYHRRWIAGHGPWGGPVRCFLRVASWMYGLAVLGRLGLYRSGLFRRARLSTRVISVGNITVGGTGKTPFVILLVQELQGRGLRPAVVLRGYGGKKEGALAVVSDGETIRLDYPGVGDEALLLARKLPGVPILMSADRVEGCQVAVRDFGAQVTVLDDGFQHLRVERDLDIVLLDGEDPFGCGFLLPRGLLREPVGGLRRADLCVMTRAGDPRGPCDVPPRLRDIGRGPLLDAVYTPTVLTDLKTKETVAEEDLRGQEVVAFSGIANPPGFARTLRSCGIFPADYLVFPDHHPYTTSDLAGIARRMEEVGATVALTTEKDAVRLEKLLLPVPVITVGVRLSLTGGQAELKRFLDALFP
ncbi:MAG: tetraacyldisaccharide 4'-kinase [Candidatus Methylomirabilales bacterium]